MNRHTTHWFCITACLASSMDGISPYLVDPWRPPEQPCSLEVSETWSFYNPIFHKAVVLITEHEDDYSKGALTQRQL